MHRGVFIAFEGGEGAGKATQVRLLRENLRAHGEQVVTTREPGATNLGRHVRELMLRTDVRGGISPRAEALMFAADRADHVERIIDPALRAGDIVITDRYEDSSIAYQGYGRQLGPRSVRYLSTWGTEGLTPDLVVLLDIDPGIGLERAQLRGNVARFEMLERHFHDRVRAGFLELAAAEPGRYLVLDATRSPIDLASEIHAHVVRTVTRIRLAAPRRPAPIATLVPAASVAPEPATRTE